MLNALYVITATALSIYTWTKYRCEAVGPLQEVGAVSLLDLKQDTRSFGLLYMCFKDRRNRTLDLDG